MNKCSDNGYSKQSCAALRVSTGRLHGVLTFVPISKSVQPVQDNYSCSEWEPRRLSRTLVAGLKPDQWTDFVFGCAGHENYHGMMASKNRLSSRSNVESRLLNISPPEVDKTKLF